MKTLKLFGTQSCQIFDVLKRYDSRTQFLGAIENMASLGTFDKTETPHKFGRHRTKIGPNPNVLA